MNDFDECEMNGQEWNAKVTFFLWVKICPQGHMTKFDCRTPSFSPVWGEPHITETAFIEKRRRKGVCMR